MIEKYIVTTNRPWECDIQFFNSFEEAKTYDDVNLDNRPTLAQVIEFNHNLFPEQPKNLQPGEIGLRNKS